MVELGDKVKDEITGFEGIAVAKTYYLHGCIQITVCPKVNDKGEVPESLAFDEPQLKVIYKKKAPKPKPTHGGVRKEPRRV